jgi:hypothetical protein
VARFKSWHRAAGFILLPALVYLSTFLQLYKWSVFELYEAPRRICDNTPTASALAGFAAMLPIPAAFIGTSMETFSRLMIFQNWI